MKSIKITLLLLAALFTANRLYAQVPSVKVETLKGKTDSTSSLVDGKTPVIVSFWSTTCKPCIRELDIISELLPDWLKEVDFRVAAVSTDDNRLVAKARSMASGRGWDDFILLFDKNQEFMRAMNVTLTPHVFIIDTDGKIVYSHTGYTPGSENELLKKLKELKNKKLKEQENKKLKEEENKKSKEQEDKK